MPTAKPANESILPKPTETVWISKSIEFDASLYPMVKAVAAERELMVREFVSEVLRAAVAEHLQVTRRVVRKQ